MLGVMKPTLELDSIGISVRIFRDDADEYGVLRAFVATVYDDAESDGESRQIGTISGWVTWYAFSERLLDAGDSISTDATTLSWAVKEIVEAHGDDLISSAILVDRMTLVEEWRGHKLSGALIANLIDLLQLEPLETVVVLEPEPQLPGGGGPYEYGPERDSAMAKLRSAYRKSGFDPWGDGPAWWRPLRATDDHSD